MPLVPMLWTGERLLQHPRAGKYHAARLKVKAELPNHQGEGTKFEYESSLQRGCGGEVRVSRRSTQMNADQTEDRLKSIFCLICVHLR